MKYLTKINEFVNESVNSYDFYLIQDDPKEFKYEFCDVVGNKYLVEFKNVDRKNLSHIYELKYYVYNNGEYSVSKIVNVNPYRILQTVFGDIINDFIKKCPFVKEIYLTGLSKEREREFISSRTRIYKRYLDMNIPKGFIVSQSGNLIKLKRK